MLKVLGFFQDKGEELSPSTVFVAIHSDNELSCYCPIGQDSKLDEGYMKECNPITKEKYLDVSKGFYTPSDYLEEELVNA
jgi:hypothetical protein